MNTTLSALLDFLNKCSPAVVAIATAFIALYTYLLRASTKKLWEEAKNTSAISKQVAEAAEKSANISEKALIDLESPYLYPVVIDAESLHKTFNSISNSGIAQNIPPIGIAIKNFGRSPGLPGSIFCALYIGEADDPKDDLNAGFHSDSLLGSGDTSKMRIQRSFGRPLGPQDCTKLLNGQFTIYLKGSIQFIDMFGNQYLQEFCLRWSHISYQFVAWGPTRNQRKRIKNAQDQ